MVTIDGNEAAARIAHAVSDVCAIYPITPASPMGEWADAWSAAGQENLWGQIPNVIEMQSEGGAAGAIHGAIQAGALASTFTASQGLLLMIPNMYKIAGELSPLVIHVAARSLAAQALSIFGDHSDVMATRATGFAMLCSGSVQEVQDLALIAHAATLKGRLPVVHFFDGFRTSHEVAKIASIDQATLRTMIDDESVRAHRQRALSPDHPVLRGSSQNPDVYFQARERVNPFYTEFPGIVESVMQQFAQLTGRRYQLFDYVGAEDAERVIVMMGSGSTTAEETIDHRVAQGEKVGLIKVRLYRPFATDAFLQALPDTVQRIAVLDRTKEPGADGEPLYKDVVTTLATRFAEGVIDRLPRVIGGRYGLSSKEFTPAMVKTVLDELQSDQPKNGFTVGIHDDVSHASLAWDKTFRTAAHDQSVQAVFYGLGSDGTVSANKNSIKIIGEQTDLHAQGYFVYDSKKSGAVTISHLRFGPQPIRSAYLIDNDAAQFVACHQPRFLTRYDMLTMAAPGAVFLLNTPLAPDKVWEALPAKVQQQLIAKQIKFYVIDGYGLAQQAGMGKRINTIMQTAFFAISGVLPQAEAITAIKQAVENTYGKKGRRIVEFNFQAIDLALEGLHLVAVPEQVTATINHQVANPYARASDFVREFTAELIAGRGDDVPVSRLPVDGSFPLGTAAIEKRDLALELPLWDEALCTQCGKCPLVCPHGVIRSKLFPKDLLADAPPDFKWAAVKGKDLPQDHVVSYQISPQDCTGCGLCVDICPIRDKSNASHKALNMVPAEQVHAQDKLNWDFFLSLPEYDRNKIKVKTIKGAMFMQPLFEFSGACEGCGETAYIKLATQLFGDRMLIANATGCSSIYGGNLPTTPYTTNPDGRGPAWSNSLFEDNAEFGLGMRIALDKRHEYATALLQQLQHKLEPTLVEQLLSAEQTDEQGIAAQRDRIKQLVQALSSLDDPMARELESVADNLVRKSVWIVGGDGWAYDIGYGGLDHVLASGADVNILVLDTEVYSNTGGQTSKATPLGAVAKFSAAGRPAMKKDLGMLAMAYENVYVAHVAYGAKDVQTLRAFLDAEAHPGPSLIIAYSPCIAHGVDMSHNHRQQQLAVNSGHWPLFRYEPQRAAAGKNPLHLDSAAPSIDYREFVKSETRFNMLWKTHPDLAEAYLAQAQQAVTARYHHYQQLAALSWDDAAEDAADPAAAEESP